MKLNFSKQVLLVLIVAIIGACTKQNEAPINTSGAKADLEASYAVTTPEYLAQGITVYDLSKTDGIYTIKSLQDNYPTLHGEGPQISGADTVFTFVSEKTGVAYRFIRSSGDSIVLRNADSVGGLEHPESYTEVVQQSYEIGSWDVNASIEPIVFFEELTDAIQLGHGATINLPIPKPSSIVERRARCPGNRNSPNNTGNVISCLMAYAAADCGGPNSFTHGEPHVNPVTGRGSMTYDCIE